MTDYRDIIRIQLKKNRGIRDYRARMASAASVDPSFLSHVLSGGSNLNPDQAMALCDFWEFGTREADIFRTLVDWERAKTFRLRQRLQERLIELDLDAHTVDALASAQKTALLCAYFSSYTTLVLHGLLEIHPQADEADLCARLRISLKELKEALRILQELALIERRADRWMLIRTGREMDIPRFLEKIHYSALRSRMSAFGNAEDDASLNRSRIFRMSKDQCRLLKEQLETIAAGVQIEALADTDLLVVLSLELNAAHG